MFGPIIEMVREGKMIKVKDLCDGLFTRAAYHRFSRGQSDTSARNFIVLLERLNISPDEFLLIYNNYMDDQVISFLKKLSNAYRNQNLQKLYALRDELESGFPETKKSHLSDLLDYRILRLNNQNVDGKDGRLFTYLMNTEFWTNYELVLFTNSMYVFSLDLIDILLMRCIRNFKRLSQIRPYGNSGFRLVVNALIVSFEKDEVFYTKKWMELLITIELEESDFFERILYVIFKGFYDIKINHDEEAVPEVIKMIECVEYIGAHEHRVMLERMLNFILEK